MTHGSDKMDRSFIGCVFLLDFYASISYGHLEKLVLVAQISNLARGASVISYNTVNYFMIS